tara:strand:+ start:3391 stop:4077 length:687 start_codon:yes stop_codon:yes gene_type:complete
MTNEINSPTVQYGVFTWGPCCVHIKISEEFHKKLLDEAFKSRVKEQDYTDRLAGILKEEYEYKDKGMFVPEIAQILGVYDEAFQKWKNEKYKIKPHYVLTSLWVNFMKKHEYNPPHDHADQLSFVIFLDVPSEIKEEAKTFKGQSGGPGSLSFVYGEGNRQAITYQSIIPQNRDMFIFPSWLKHYVAPFYSDVTRISVSGNVASSVPLNQVEKNEKAKIIAPAKVEAG